MVRENQIHAAAVNVELFAEIFASHGRALAVPSGESLAPGRRPAHDVFGLRFFPQSEVHLVALLPYSVEFTAGVAHLLKITPRQHAVVEILIVFHHVEIDRSVAHIGISRVENLLYELNLLNNMSGGVGFDRGRQHIELLHGLIESVGVELRHLHRLELFDARLLGDFVFAFVCIMLQVADVSNVANVAHLVSNVPKIAK